MADTFPIAKMLVLVDGTESGVRALRLALRLAAVHKAKVTAIGIVDISTLRSLLTSKVLVETEMEEFAQQLEASARTNLRYAEQLAREAAVALDAVLKKGSVHSTIIEEARRLAPDVIVMGSFSTTMIKRDLSARERRLIVDEVKCAILLVP